MSLRTPLAALTAAAVVAGLAAVPASASKAPTAAQKAAIAKAAKTTPVGGANKVPKAWYRIDRIRISSKSSNWALAWQTATKKGEGKFQPAYLILVNPAGTKGWTVVDLGTALVGCGIAPNAVVEDLVGPCPPGEGVS
jgi:hypothetical protein